MNALHWSQWVAAVALVGILALNTELHGKPRFDTFHGPIAIIVGLLVAYILLAGGFWG